MGRTKYNIDVCRFPFNELPDVFAGQSKLYPYPWLATEWKPLRGIDMCAGVELKSTHNPVVTGQFEFTFPEKYKLKVNFVILMCLS